MGQQLGIIVLIDIPAAIERNTLDGNIWLVDNGGWDGSTGEGSPHLVSAIDATDAAIDPGNAILNWLVCGIGTIPIAVPQTFFLEDGDRASLRALPLTQSSQVEEAPTPDRTTWSARTRSLAGDHVRPERVFAAARSDSPAPLSGPDYVDPGTARFKRTGKSRVAQAGDQTLVYYPDPVILRVHGEALDAGVIYPAQYGSPAMFSAGLYWSASVDPSRLGLYRYTLDIGLYYSRRDARGSTVEESVILSHDAWIKVSTGLPRNGFRAVALDLIPSVADGREG